MTSLQHSYRTEAVVIRSFLIALFFACTLLRAQKTATPAGASHVEQTKQDVVQDAAIVQRQQASMSVMNASLARQRAAAQSQIASTVPSSDFFTNNWTTA